MSVFLSYAHLNREEADRVDRELRRQGLDVVRDIRDAGYRADLAGFAEGIRDCAAAVILLSDAYLKSRWCLFEALQLLQERDFADRIIPVVLDDARIYTAEERIEYITYWNEKYAALREKAQGLTPEQSVETAAELKLYTSIKTEISPFMTRLGQWKLLSLRALAAGGFSEVVAAVGRGEPAEGPGTGGQGNPAGLQPAPGRTPQAQGSGRMPRKWGNLLAATGVVVALALVIIGLAGEIPDLFGSNQPGTVTVLVHGLRGKDELVLPGRGMVKLVYGDAIVSKQINNEGEATFKQISPDFFQPGAEVEVLFYDPAGEPYRAAEPDRRYQLKRGEYISLTVALEGLDRIWGVVIDSADESFVEGVRISVRGAETFSDNYGEFNLEIPPEDRRKQQTLKAFKTGYEPYTRNDVRPQIDEEFAIFLDPEE